MNKNSNTYIITYASVMVIIVAAVLSFTSLSLKNIQAENVRVEKMGDILKSIGEGDGAETAPDKAAYIKDMYAKYIVDSYAVNEAGDKVDGADAFNILINLKNEYDKPAAERELPVFVSRNAEGVESYILPTWGAGLWGPVWGYVALSSDWNTIVGVVLDHKGETPGLGAEIATPKYQAQFKGKKIIKDGEVVGISLVKGGAKDDDLYGVDAVSGGTLTSIGVENMLKSNLKGYAKYIEKQLAGVKTAAVDVQTPSQTDSLTVNVQANE